jgi:hypothetical protein
MADAVTVEQIRGESNELREAALRLREQAASLIEKAMELEQIARLQRNSPITAQRSVTIGKGKRSNPKRDFM